MPLLNSAASRYCLLPVVVIGFVAVLSLAAMLSSGALANQGLALAKVGTEQVYFTYNGKPLLSFGTFSDFVFYAAEDAYDYRQWADWAAKYGMNHARAYLPGSWTHIEAFAQENGGSLDNVLFPYLETSPGSREFDLTRFNPAYWQRFREQCQYLASKGIIIDLLILNGWQFASYSDEVRALNWGGHFFNPDNNSNAFTDHLGDNLKNRFKFYHSVADGETELFNAQKAYFEKIIEVTHDLGNIYYELVHEIGPNSANWAKTSQWIEAMAKVVRDRWTELEPDRQIILGIDAGHLRGFPFSQAGGLPAPDSEIDWVFTRPYFDILVWGNVHHVANVREWRRHYKKPYIPQESFDDIAQKWSYRHPEQRVHIRKYLWKLMTVKAQQLDVYMKARKDVEDQPGYPHNYDPNGWNPFADDALMLRHFWNSLRDYPNLDFKGHVVNAPVGHHLVLSSSKEAIAYLSSPTGIEGMAYSPGRLRLQGLALADGQYTARFFDPEQGTVTTEAVSVVKGQARLNYPPFADDMAVHLYRRFMLLD